MAPCYLALLSFKHCAQDRREEQSPLIGYKKMNDKTGDYYSEQNLKVAQDLQNAGINMEKEWSTVGDDNVCEICQRNEDTGWIPINQPFPSGHQRPLAHSKCRCDMLTRRIKTPHATKNTVKAESVIIEGDATPEQIEVAFQQKAQKEKNIKSKKAVIIAVSTIVILTFCCIVSALLST